MRWVFRWPFLPPAGRRGMRKPILTSTTSLTLRDTMQRLQLFTWTGTKSAWPSPSFSERELQVQSGSEMNACCAPMNSFPFPELLLLCVSFSSIWSHTSRSAGFWVTGESLRQSGDWWMSSKRSKMSPLTENWLGPSIPPPVPITVFPWAIWGDRFPNALSLTSCLASLAPPSGKCVFLRPVLVLLFHGACCVWTPHRPGGLPGRHAAWCVLGHPEVLEVTLETLLQPQQAGKVSRSIITLGLFVRKGMFSGATKSRIYAGKN